MVGRRFCNAFVLSVSVISWTISVAGCASSSFVMLRDIPANPLSVPLDLFSLNGPEPTERTFQLLRRYDLKKQFRETPQEATDCLQRLAQADPSAEKMYALAELAYINGQRAVLAGDMSTALDRYGESATSAYTYLLDTRFDWERNPYDPQFRRACDVYNGALEQVLRILKNLGELRPGSTCVVETKEQSFDVSVVMRGAWHEEDFGDFEFVSDYRVEGLKNHYRTYGLGVPLIAIRQNHPDQEPHEKYYPSGLVFPVTALLRVMPQEGQAAVAGGRRRCVLELHDPLVSSNIRVADRLVPLETDLSTPLGYFLEQPIFKGKELATRGLLHPGPAQEIRGLYMLEPYDPQKIPVVMVHGLWSSPLTWMEMFNDLRGLPEVRNHYQFWFYLYPTGQPFWISATQFREDLMESRSTLDPQRQNSELDKMVLVGHSMGGLVSKMQAIDSQEDFWNIVSQQPFDNLSASLEVRESLEKTFFFQANPSIQRVITIATPHRGSNFSNGRTQLLSRWLIDMPRKLVGARDQVLKDNPDLIVDRRLFLIDTSIESLAPESPVLPVMLNAALAPWVKHHNIVGLVSHEAGELGVKERLVSRVSERIVGDDVGEGDGIVEFANAHLENVSSEIVVDADHTGVHRHPRSILEVRRILMEHLKEVGHSDKPVVPVSQVPTRPEPDFFTSVIRPLPPL